MRLEVRSLDGGGVHTVRVRASRGGIGQTLPIRLTPMLERAQVIHVARLARLELTDAEVERMATELSKVLGHIEKISELDLDGVEPTSHVVDVVNVLREDEPRPSLSP